MENTKNIYSKLLEFQKQEITVKKDAKNPFFKSSYVTLNEVLDKVKKPLNDLGVLIIFAPENKGLKVTLHDCESATEINGFMEYVGANDPQKLLSCNTYYRRGILVSLLGLEDEDDDGNKASQPAKKELPKQETTASNNYTATDITNAEMMLKTASTIEDLQNKYLSLTAEMRKMTLKIKDELKEKLNPKTK